jgi:hypothetical protein
MSRCEDMKMNFHIITLFTIEPFALSCLRAFALKLHQFLFTYIITKTIQ